ncbi:MAG: HNH endonuclease [Acidobacteria bacterium]|nr:HNH endonuclease [Acidobacteriota bacterium]
MAVEKGKPWPSDSFSWEQERIETLNKLLTSRGIPLQWDRSELRDMIWNARRGILPTRHCVLAGHRSEELVLRVKHAVLREENALDKLRREVEAFENFERIRATPREPIPEHVRMFVWQRDRGRCAKCGCQERLEFDHIIPLAKGGSNTERNVQLLCESCNRAKGAIIS